MSRLITRPDSLWDGFVEGAWKFGSGAGLPLVCISLVRFWAAGPLRVLAFTVPMALLCALAGGLVLALWRGVQGWAYDRFADGPPSG